MDFSFGLLVINAVRSFLHATLELLDQIVQLIL